MPVPKLTFFCELDTHALNKLIDNRVIADLKALDDLLSQALYAERVEREESGETE